MPSSRYARLYAARITLWPVPGFTNGLSPIRDRILNIVFDLGGVIVTWRPREIIAKVFPDPEVQATVHAEIIEHSDWLALDRGTLSLEQAIARAATRTGLAGLEIAQFMNQVPPALTAIPDSVDLLYRLKDCGHALYCLSNMQHASIEHLETAYSFWEVFSGRVISSRVQLLKPEPHIYAHLLETHHLKAEETIFVDDMEANLTAAARFGIRTVKFENPAQCEQALQRLGCL
jgi:putative hydrolase of the HAD superfamily